MRAALNAANVGIRHPYCLGATTSTRYFTGFSDTIVQFFNAVRATQFFAAESKRWRKAIADPANCAPSTTQQL
jgi:hypothetical protein